jgi:hypothetical protein
MHSKLPKWLDKAIVDKAKSSCKSWPLRRVQVQGRSLEGDAGVRSEYVEEPERRERRK